MKLLEEKILNDAEVLPGGVIRVDSFLNHQIDTSLAAEMAKEWKKLYEGEKITKIVTIEASGIGLASIAGMIFGVPVVFAKKTKSSNLGNDLLFSRVTSFTHGTTYSVTISKKLLSAEDRILIIDDFLAGGSALHALIQICKNAGASIAGAGIAIEKSYQRGGANIRLLGYRVESLAKTKSISDNGQISFED
jgi:xanthine phosphoribosyltransferase